MGNFFETMCDRKWSPIAVAAMIVGGVILAALFAFVFGWIVMLLWNWLMPGIFNLPRIGYWQAWGLVLLSHILLKPGCGHSPQNAHGKSGHRKRKWKNELKERFSRSDADGETGDPQTDES